MMIEPENTTESKEAVMMTVILQTNTRTMNYVHSWTKQQSVTPY